MNKDSRWYLKPLQPILRDWKKALEPRITELQRRRMEGEK